MVAGKKLLEGKVSGNKQKLARGSPSHAQSHKSKKPKKPVRTLDEIISHNLKILFDLFSLFGYKEDGHEIEKCLPHYRMLVAKSDGDWMGVFKYKTAAFFAYWMGEEEQPLCPFKDTKDLPNFLVSGRASRWLGTFLRRGLSKYADKATLDNAASFLTSVQQAKKGFEKPGAKLLAEKTIKFFQTLTAPQPEDVPKTIGDGPYEIVVDRTILEQQIQRTVFEVFGHKAQKRQKMTPEEVLREDLEKMTHAYFPSTSANYISSRADAGSVGPILCEAEYQGIRRSGGYILDPHNEERIENEGGDLSFRQNPESLKQAMRKLWFLALAKAETEPNIAIPVALAEALKVRVITKGPPFKMYILKYVQKELHTALKHIRQFALIGSPTGDLPYLEDYLQRVLQLDKESLAQGSRFEKKELFISGDYKAATDAMKKWASETAANAICDALGYPDTIRTIVLESLTGYTIQLDDEFETSAKQTVGQLMGSIISFPILCIVNAAISRFAHERGLLKEVLIRDMPMAINGDDVVIRTTEAGKLFWRAIVGMVGLEESIGKTYYSSEYLQINSTNFLYRDGRLHQVPYVNMGLVTGQKRSGGQSSLYDLQSDDGLTFGQRYRMAIRMAPESMKKPIHRLFVKYNKKVLSQNRLPWYIPEWLGGLGLTGVYEPDELDLRRAQKILYEWKIRQPYPLGSSPSKWKIWDIAKRRLPKPHHSEIEDEGTRAWEAALNAEAMNLLLDSRIKLTDLKTGGDKGFIKRKIASNEKLWNTRGALPHPLDRERLKSKKIFESIQAPVNITEKRVLTIELDEESVHAPQIKVEDWEMDVPKDDLTSTREELDEEWESRDRQFDEDHGVKHHTVLPAILEETESEQEEEFKPQLRPKRTKPLNVQLYQQRKALTARDRKRDSDKFWESWNNARLY